MFYVTVLGLRSESAYIYAIVECAFGKNMRDRMTNKHSDRFFKTKLNADDLDQVNTEQVSSQTDVIELDGQELESINQVNEVARGATVGVATIAVDRVKRARLAVEEAVESGDVIYRINTGFGSNAKTLYLMI